MLNIKIYGINVLIFEKLLREIKEILKKESYKKDIIVTRVYSDIFDLDFKPQVYIEIETHDAQLYQHIKEKLKPLEIVVKDWSR